MDLNKNQARVILHVDMNCFYAAVEVVHNPALRGKPLAIAGNAKERRGIIITCSYEARKFGVKTTMPIWEAQKLCPKLIVMEPNFDRYRQASAAMFDLLREYSDCVEPVSIDEGYVDITDTYGTDPIQYVKSIQDQILQRLHLPSSIGVAPNKFLAKMASNMKKPMGLTVLRKRDLPHLLWGEQITKMHGVGAKTAEKLATFGIQTIGELAKADERQLGQVLGVLGKRLVDRANGIDDRPVDPDSIFDFKSVGNSTTLPRDITNQKELEAVLEKLSQKLASRLAYKSLLAMKLHVTIRYKDRQTINRGMTLVNPIEKWEEVFQHAKTLFLNNWDGSAIRLLGVTAGAVIEKGTALKQLELFTYEIEEQSAKLQSVLDEFNAKYGDNFIQKGLKSAPMLTNTSFSKDFLQKKNEQK